MKNSKFLGKCPVNVLVDVPLSVDCPACQKWFIVGYYSGTAFRISDYCSSAVQAASVADSLNRQFPYRSYNVYSVNLQMFLSNYAFVKC